MIQHFTRKTLGVPIQVFRRHRAKSAVVELTSHAYPTVKAIGDALHEALTNTLSAEEQRMLSSIEQRRSFLLSSDQPVTIIDYGAGSRRPHKGNAAVGNRATSTARVADVCKASKSPFWATVLFKLVRALKPSSCVELGSCVGISAAYQAAALALNKRGQLHTLEGSPEVASIAQETLERVNLHNASVVTGPFHDTLAGVLEAAKPVDFFFNDGHHDHDAVLRYFDTALPYLSREAVVVLDDISWSPGMRRAWKQLAADKRVIASVDLHTLGIVVVGNNVIPRAAFSIPL